MRQPQKYRLNIDVHKKCTEEGVEGLKQGIKYYYIQSFILGCLCLWRTREKTGLNRGSYTIVQERRH